MVADLKVEACRRGLWNMFITDPEWGCRSLRARIRTARRNVWLESVLAPEATNCAAPDTGNMEILAMFGTEEQQQRWLVPLSKARSDPASR